jgi:hypothetical protein
MGSFVRLFRDVAAYEQQNALLSSTSRWRDSTKWISRSNADRRSVPESHPLSTFC